MLFCSAFKDETKLSDTCDMAVWGCGLVQAGQLNTSVRVLGQRCACLGLSFTITVYRNWTICLLRLFSAPPVSFSFWFLLSVLLNVLDEWFSTGIWFEIWGCFYIKCSSGCIKEVFILVLALTKILWKAYLDVFEKKNAKKENETPCSNLHDCIMKHSQGPKCPY